MSRRSWSYLLMVVVLLAGSLGFTAPAHATAWQDKVDAWVMTTAAGAETEFLVFLEEQADLSGAAKLRTKLEKGTYVYQTLVDVADRTQQPVLGALQRMGVEYRSYWVANMIWVRGDLNAVQAMAQRSDVKRIFANPHVKFAPPAVNPLAVLSAPQAIEWNISKVNADDVWAAGYTGQGVVIGGQDTGYEWDHPALINQYRGWDGANADHNYSWHDAVHAGGSGGVCGVDSPEPCDDWGHGTHTMGTMVGDDGGSNQIGMAPGARWIGCRNMDVGDGTPAMYAECYQWFIAPTDLNDLNPRPDLAPDVINNSWGCPVSEGCTDPAVLLTVVQNVRAAGIVTAHSAGNSGPSCSTVNTPGAIYDESFTVGGTNSSDAMYGSSSRGPVTVDGSGRRKPDVAAPGVDIRSSVPGGSYEGGWQGTSMAAPHVAGEVALLISAAPQLAGQVDEIENIIEQSAFHIDSSACGSSGYPNNSFGWGRIDAWAAYQMLPRSDLGLSKTVSAAQILPGETLTYTLTVENSGNFSITNVVLTDTLPANTSFVTASQPYDLQDGVVRWDFAYLDTGVSVEVTLTVQVAITASGVINNADYAVRSDQQIGGVRGKPVTTLAVPYELSLAKEGVVMVLVDDLITYTLTATNQHPWAAMHDLVLTDTLPVSTTFVTATLPYTIANGTVTWELPELNAQAVWTVTLVVQAPDVGGIMVVNEHYGLVSAEVPTPVGGAPVNTVVAWVFRYVYLPLVIK